MLLLEFAYSNGSSP